MTPERLQALRDLAIMARDAELAKVADVTRRISALRLDISRLKDARAAREADPALDTARLAGADLPWAAWCEGQLRARQNALAALHVAHETALQAARQAFGRAEALAGLSERAVAERRKARTRRAF
ncbi:hypothetical protein OCGS_2105 [Oceaniovalibus guishaninsula JLT2003]|uniref:Flagellar export protein FliJ n=1 Tax=Oceaniovalibus guishaninsula JLT2003 TaxID=1231392 RepID=K2GM14_9RHOB|nr:hypothetical protein [Oceaniovalibus guishaninsula]EKE43771.1 hypothetical protein OCGS_2105 [Oceaniovalibus guishaninsula JLT2003]